MVPVACVLLGFWISLSAQENILERLDKQEKWRHEALREYRGERRYSVTSTRFGEAAMGVRVRYSWPGNKDIEVLWQSGSATLHSRVLRKLIETEVEAAGEGNRDQARFNTRNYRFRLLGSEIVNGRLAYVFEIEPRAKKKFLLRGRLWVDAEDAAVVRVDASPVAPGFWLRNIRILLEYRKVGPFWLIASNRSRADVRFFGSARLAVDYSAYQVNGPLFARDSAQ